MKKFAILAFLFAPILAAQVQIGKNVQIGFSSSTSPGITALTGDGTASGPGSAALTLATVNGAPGTCGDATHVSQIAVNGKGLTTTCTPVVISPASPAGGNYAIQYANGSALGGANFTGFVFNNGSSSAPSQATAAQVIALLGVPLSAKVLASNASGQLILATDVPFLDASNVWTGSINAFESFVNLLAAVPATSSFNQAAPPFNFIGNYWTGTASATDEWDWQAILGNGANPDTTLTLAHSGSSGDASVVIPYPVAAKNITTSEFVSASGAINSNTEILANVILAEGPGNQNSPPIGSQAGYWTGSASAPDNWLWTNILGTGSSPTSTYTLAHTGSSGATAISMLYPISVSALSVGTNLVNGAGMQVAVGAGCTPTAGAALNRCTDTITLPIAEPDTNYQAICSVAAVNTIMGTVNHLTTTNLMLDIYTANTSTPIVTGDSCIVIHN